MKLRLSTSQKLQEALPIAFGARGLILQLAERRTQGSTARNIPADLLEPLFEFNSRHCDSLSVARPGQAVVRR